MLAIDQTLCILFMDFMGLYCFKEFLPLKRIILWSILTWREILYNFIKLSFREFIIGRSLYSLSLFPCGIALLSFTWMFDICKNLLRGITSNIKGTIRSGSNFQLSFHDEISWYPITIFIPKTHTTLVLLTCQLVVVCLTYKLLW